MKWIEQSDVLCLAASSGGSGRLCVSGFQVFSKAPLMSVLF